jgi:hypothetical protein
MTAAPTLLVSLRNGAILAALAAAPILVGFAWNAIWGEPGNISRGTAAALVFAWFAGAGVVAVQSFLALREGNSLAWFYPCTRCQRKVAIVSFRCIYCKSKFDAPPESIVFRNGLLLGIAVFYATFALGAFLLRRS